MRVVVNVTSDKCYENREWEWAYREDEPMGGTDPYSASKGAAELVTAAYRRSFFSAATGPRLASARAGNVIGGGDWGVDRLLPDVVRATLAGAPVAIRNPRPVRPWQHVLNPLSGYLRAGPGAVGRRPSSPGRGTSGRPRRTRGRCAGSSSAWRRAGPAELPWVEDPGAASAEAHHLKIDSSRARARLGWRPGWSLDEGAGPARRLVRARCATARSRARSTLGQIEAFVAAR